MSNPLRMVYDNAADRATLSVTGTVVLPVSNLNTNDKWQVYRSAAGTLSVTFTGTFFSPEKIGCVALPYCNFSSTATMRVRLYSDAGCTQLLLDSGVKLCSQGSGGKVGGLAAVQSASAYSWGGGCAAAVWMTPTAGVYGVKIDIVDTSNLQGYLEAARMVIGDYFSPMFNAEYGASAGWEVSTENYRTDAGNLLSDVGTMHKKLSCTLSFLQPSDRAALWKLVKYAGRHNPIFMSLYPENSDSALEQDHTIYGKFTSLSMMAATNYLIYSSPLEIEGL